MLTECQVHRSARCESPTKRWLRGINKDITNRAGRKAVQHGNQVAPSLLGTVNLPLSFKAIASQLKRAVKPVRSLAVY